MREGPSRDPETERSMADVISFLLVGGVTISAIWIAIGFALLLAGLFSGDAVAASWASLRSPAGASAVPNTLAEVGQGLLRLEPYSVIDAGTIILILTPVLRVAASAVLFLREHDRFYGAVTTVVLALLLISVFYID